jgi:hypothetical protein
MNFRARIDLNGKTATGIRVPDDLVTELGGGRHPKVRVTIGTTTYPSSIARMGGFYLIPVSAEIRKRADVRAGDEVDVTIELDARPREVVLPPGLRRALDGHPAARAALAKLSYSNQRRLVEPIAQAKKEETRRRRIDKMLATLLERAG